MVDTLNLTVTLPNLLEATDVGQVLKLWEENCDNTEFMPTQYLTRLSEIIESELEQYIKLDPDPFDDRLPSKTHPNCSYGQSLKLIFKKENFMEKLVHTYLKERWGVNDLSVHTASCRLFISILPGLETSVFYQDTEDLVKRLYKWAEYSPDPLKSYALGLLGASMEVAEVASKFKDKNLLLVPLTLCRLRGLQLEMISEIERPFSKFSTPSKVNSSTSDEVSTPKSSSNKQSSESETDINESSKANGVNKENSNLHLEQSDAVILTTTPIITVDPTINSTPLSSMKRKRNLAFSSRDFSTRKRQRIVSDYDEVQNLLKNDNCFDDSPVTDSSKFDRLEKNMSLVNECSSSSWLEMESNIIGMIQIYPLTLASKQILALRYLTPISEYQEMLSFAFKNNAVELILNYLDTLKTKDSRLTFEALKYLSSLLCHKKFCIEFIRKGGILKMLKIPRPSISATGVSLCLYYIGYSEDTMEKVCQLPKSVLANVVNYVMWLLECSHASGRNHAMMFFGAAYPFKVLLDLFDTRDGLRSVLNVLSTLPNFLTDENDSEDSQAITRQVVRQVGYNLKRYFESHLSFLAEKIKRTQAQNSEPVSATHYYQPLRHDPAKLREINNFVLPLMPLWARWHPVDKLIKLGGLQHLIQVIAFAYDWNYSGRGETVKSVLDVLSICCLVPRVQAMLAERLTLQGSSNLTYGISVILSAAEGEVVADPDVQRSALYVIGNCVCGPLKRTGVTLDQFQYPNPVSKTPLRKSTLKSSEELLTKIWECVRVNNGILILTRLLTVKTPIRDADSIRALACWCLAGLARYRPVCQVLEQLPLMNSGLIQMLMREPILQENRQEHAVFQKHALELIKLVYGRITGVEYDLNLVAIHNSDLVSQSKIIYNEKQLLELVHKHLLSKGLKESASVLAKEAKIETFQIQSHSSSISSSCSTPTSSSKNSLVNGLPLTPARKGKSTFGFLSPPSKPRVTLDTIVREYLTNQHALCKTPMAVCPPFDLVVPHKCPSRKTRTPLVNFAARFGRADFDWSKANNLNRKLIYSKFRPIRVFRSSDEDHYTTSAFSSCNQWSIVGTHSGEVKLINILTGVEDGVYSCHDSEIHHVEPNRAGNLLLTSSIWRRPLTKLWRMDTLFEMLIEFDKEEYAEFSRLSQDKIISTSMEHAYVYDIETKKKISSFEARMSNGYTKNRATFDPSDELILCDGVLWDFKSGKEVHKFDKLNESISGVFHPKGLEIIANSEVWDVRTFKLLRTVRTLDQCSITFTNDGEIIYGLKCEKEPQAERSMTSSNTSFVTIDATDYEPIGTIELKKSIYSLATSPNDLQIALVENSNNDDSICDSCVKFYEVGKSKVEEEENAAEEEDDDELQSQDSDDDDDDDDNDDDLDLDVDRLLDELLPTEGEDESGNDDDGDGGVRVIEIESDDDENENYDEEEDEDIRYSVSNTTSEPEEDTSSVSSESDSENERI